MIQQEIELCVLYLDKIRCLVSTETASAADPLYGESMVAAARMMERQPQLFCCYLSFEAMK